MLNIMRVRLESALDIFGEQLLREGPCNLYAVYYRVHR